MNLKTLPTSVKDVIIVCFSFGAIDEVQRPRLFQRRQG